MYGFGFKRPFGFLNASQALLVFAHPDDESMFFSPTIIALKYQGVTMHVLCLSDGAMSSALYISLGSADCSRRSAGIVKGCVHFMLLGNYDGIGSVRRQELLAACGVLGVSCC